MSTTDSTELTPAQILDRHPLFRRLSGQIVWYMFEENEAREEDLHAFMDRINDLREEVLEQTELALEKEEMFLRIEQHGPQAPCERCAKLVGKHIQLNMEQSEKMLPPYALGCPLKGELVPPSEGAPDANEILSADADIPHGELICGEWIFTHPWAEQE